MSLPSLSLDAFYACAQSGHFTEAAEKLFITQSALSQRISKLEDELETTLFIRTPQGAQLTPAGQELLRYCLARESLENEALSRIQGESDSKLSGTIRIGGFSSVMRSVILPSLQKLLVENPNLKLSFVTKQMDDLPQLLRQGEIDYMVHYTPLYRDEIETLELGSEPNVLVEKKNYKGPNVFLDHDERDETTARYLKLKKSKQTYQRRYMDDVYGLIDGVKMGLGRAIIPTHLIKNDKDLRIIDKKTTFNFPVILHYYKQPFYSQLHHVITERLQDQVPRYLK